MVEEIIKEHINKTLSSPASIAVENTQCQSSNSELAKSKDEPETAKTDAERSVNENSGEKDDEKEMTEVSAAKVGHFYSS